MKHNCFTVRPVDATEVRPLRQRVLRPHQRAEELLYPGDEAADSRHYAAFDGAGTIVAVGSVYRMAHEERPEIGEWRLRGMASAPAVRGHGTGGAVLRAALAYAASISPSGIWCNARLAACDFYSHYAFERVGDRFDIEGIGPHYVMTRCLQPADIGLAPELDSSKPERPTKS